MHSITLRHGLFLMVILHVARCAYVTQRTLQNSGQFMRSLEVSATDNVEENIPAYAMLSLSRIVVANQLLLHIIGCLFSVHVRRMTSPPSKVVK